MNKPMSTPTSKSLPPLGQSPSLIIFGGTFDPPHSGHAACLKALIAQFPATRIAIIPAAVPPPTGTQAAKTPWLTFEARLELCRLMVSDQCAEEFVDVLDIEGQLSHPNYTLNTLKALQPSAPSNHSGTRLAILVGGDQFAGFDSWHLPDQIVEMADLIIVPRANEAIQWPQGEAAKKARVWALNVHTPAASSTLIREMIQSGDALPQGWLTPGVLSRLQQLAGKAIETRV